jgi:hypothetical protein
MFIYSNICLWFIIRYLYMMSIDKFGSDVQRQKWLPRITSLELMCSYCLTEPGIHIYIHTHIHMSTLWIYVCMDMVYVY